MEIIVITTLKIDFQCIRLAFTVVDGGIGPKFKLIVFVTCNNEKDPF